jgi:hypothetical protein
MVLDPKTGLFTREWFFFLKDDRWRQTAEQTITSGTQTAILHGLNTIPAEVQTFLVCDTTELGYASGDRVVAPAFEDSNDYGIQTVVNGTSLIFVVGANGVRVMDRTGGSVGAFAAITNGNWRVIIRAKP